MNPLDQYHLYNYSNTNYTFTHAPANNHLIVETPLAIYYVSTDNRLQLWKYTIATHTDALITTRSVFIQAIWYDRTNGVLWCGDGSDLCGGFLFSWKVTIATDTVTPISTFSDLPRAYSVGDLFIIGANTYMICGIGTGAIYVFDVDTDPFVQKDLDATGYVYISFGVVIGTDFYCFGDNTFTSTIGIIKYESATSTIIPLDSIVGYSMTSTKALRGLAYDGNDTIYFILNKDADSKNYLCTYSIVGDVITDTGIEYNVSLMLDRNSLTTNPICFNTEKAFDVSIDANYCAKVYQISKGRSHLNAISQLQLGVGDSIVAVTDTYLIVNNSGTIELWQYVDFISYIGSQSYILARQKGYWECHLWVKETGALGDFLIFDGMWVTILGNLTRSENATDVYYYNSPDPLMELADGTSGTDIPWVDTATLPGACLCYVGSINNHNKVIVLTHDGGASDPIIIHNLPAAVATLTYEWWWGSSDVSKNHELVFRNATNQNCVWLRINSSKYYYYDLTVLTEIVGVTPTNNILAQFKIVIDCSTDKFDLYINGTLRVNQGDFNIVATSISNIIVTDASNNAYSQYISAPSNVADANYYEGQNLVKTKIDQVIFEGYLHTSDLKPLRKCWIDSPSLFDLKHKLTAGTYGAARTDQNIVSMLGVDSNYVVEGTMANGTAAITTIVRGNKTLQTQLNSYGQLDGFTYVIIPDQGQGLLNYDDGTVDSLVNITEGEKISNVDGKKQRAIINQVTVKGAINPATGIPYTGTANDTASQKLYGVQPISRTFANLYSNAACLAQATAILTIQQLVPYTYIFQKKIGWEGLVLPHECITLSYSPDSMIASGQRIINSLEFYFRKGICKWEVQDAISYTTEMELLKQDVEENSDLIEQLAYSISPSVRKEYYISTTAELTAAITAIEAGVYSATITLTANLTDVQATVNNVSVDITIDGQGHTMDSNGDNTVLTITSVHKLILKNIEFDASAFTSPTTAVINILSSTFPSYIENCVCYGPVATKLGYFINNATSLLTVFNCKIYYLAWGIYNTAIECQFLNNKIHNGYLGGIYIGVAAHDCLLDGNNIQDIDRNHDTTPSYGIYVVNGADRIRILGNYVDSIINSGASTGYGILIEGANSDNCVVVGNGSHNCKTSNYTNSGTSTTEAGNDTT